MADNHHINRNIGLLAGKHMQREGNTKTLSIPYPEIADIFPKKCRIEIIVVTLRLQFLLRIKVIYIKK